MGGGLKAVGSGQKALVYLGRYLYRGVCREEHRANRMATSLSATRTAKPARWKPALSAAWHLRLILQHILPKGYRRARNFGFLHPSSKLIPLVQLIKRVGPPPQPRPGYAEMWGERSVPVSKYSPTDYGLLSEREMASNATHTVNRQTRRTGHSP